MKCPCPWVALAVVVLLACSSCASTPPPVYTDPISLLLSSVYPGSRVEIIPRTPHSVFSRARLSKGGITRVVDYSRSLSITSEGKNYTAYILFFPAHGSGIDEEMLQSRRAYPGLDDMRLVVVEADAWGEPRHVALDPRAAWTWSHDLKFADLIGIGTPQLVATAECGYGSHDESGQRIFSRRRFAYSFPDLQPLFAATIYRNVTVAVGANIEETRRIEFHAGEGGERVLRVLDESGTVLKSVSPDREGRYDVQDEPWLEIQDERSIVPTTVLVRVLDDAGKPLAGVTVRGNAKWIGTGDPLMPEKFTSVKGTTDSDGEFRADLGVLLELEFAAPGFYGHRVRFWPPLEFPKERVDIVLEREHPRVPMHGYSTTRRFWELDLPVMSLGLRLVDGDALGGSKVVTDDVDAADIWISIEKGAEGSDWKSWKMSLEGRNGWQLAPGPVDADKADRGTPMREAPADGYTDHLVFEVGQCPMGIYLREHAGKRYGKLYGLRFVDQGSKSQIERGLWAAHLVQATSVDSRSLNPTR